MKCVMLAVVGILVIGFVTMLLWNWLVPTLFNGPTITYLQSLGLLLLSKILSWGFFTGKKYSHGYSADETPEWKKRFYEKFSSMSPQEKEAFKQKMKEKWCKWENKSSEERSPAARE